MIILYFVICFGHYTSGEILLIERIIEFIEEESFSVILWRNEQSNVTVPVIEQVHNLLLILDNEMDRKELQKKMMFNP